MRGGEKKEEKRRDRKCNRKNTLEKENTTRIRGNVTEVFETR